MASEKVIDVFFARRIFVDVGDIYAGTVDISNIISSLGVKEIENLYETDGPNKRTSYVAELIKPLDRNSRLKITFDAKGDDTLNTLTLDVAAEFQMRLIEVQGIVLLTFHEYYRRHVAPFLRKLAQQELISVWNFIEYQIKLRFKYSYA
jgi:hypothetical protein